MSALTAGTGAFGLLQAARCYDLEGPELVECEAVIPWDAAERCVRDHLWVLDAGGAGVRTVEAPLVNCLSPPEKGAPVRTATILVACLLYTSPSPRDRG